MVDNLSSVERLLKRDRQIVIGELVLVTVLACAYTISGVGMGSHAFEISRIPWTAASGHNSVTPLPGMSYIFVLLTMWWVMMIAMILPSAAPTILLTAALNRRSTSDRPPYGAAAF